MPNLNCNNKDKSIKINGFDNQNNMLLKQINGVELKMLKNGEI